MSVLPEAIRHFWCLESLNISANSMRSLPDGLGDLTKLEILDASCNAIEALPKSVESMHCMRTLIMNENMISTLPARLGALTALKTLNLDDNALTDLPPSFASLISLETLSMCRNQILSLAICPIAYTLKDAPMTEEEKAEKALEAASRRPKLTDLEGGGGSGGYTPRGGGTAGSATAMGVSNPAVPGLDFSKLSQSTDWAPGGSLPKPTTSKMALQLRRKALANRDESEWKIKRNAATRGVEFINIITSERTSTMPKQLDLLGRLNCLRVLKVS